MGFEREWDSKCPRVWDQWEVDGITWTVEDLAPEDDERAVEILREYQCPEEIICVTGDHKFMGFTREWDSTCPRIWDQWEAIGIRWIIQDLLPEDDDRALQILLDHLCPDEIMCTSGGVLEDPISIKSLSTFWRDHCLSKRTSLGCYREVNGVKTLIGLNVCVVTCDGEEKFTDIDERDGKAWKHICDTLNVMESKVDVFKLLNSDKLLTAVGLVVMREYRGDRLGGRILDAREPLCRALGIKGSTTVFTGVAAQKLAAKCGFTTVAQISLKGLAEAGLNYVQNEDRFIKLMVKKYE